jgi:hypothetical protein
MQHFVFRLFNEATLDYVWYHVLVLWVLLPYYLLVLKLVHDMEYYSKISFIVYAPDSSEFFLLLATIYRF